MPLGRLLAAAERALRGIVLVPVDRDLLVVAGSFSEPRLRALDAVHVATALAIADDLDSFVSYDQRQSQAARIAGLPLVQPGT